MLAQISHKDRQYQINLTDPVDISIPLKDNCNSVNAFHAPMFKVEPFKSGDFIGLVSEGSPVNFVNLQINPHGNGTHTECVGHICDDGYTINQTLKTFFFLAELITITPMELANGDRVIYREHIQNVLKDKRPEALVIRTMPNDRLKMAAHYSGRNPPYMDSEATDFLRVIGVKHLLIDLPSVDREEDEGKLRAHRSFWDYPQSPRTDSTITELIYVPNHVEDGSFFVNIQIASLEIDASPSKPVLYRIL